MRRFPDSPRGKHLLSDVCNPKAFNQKGVLPPSEDRHRAPEIHCFCAFCLLPFRGEIKHFSPYLAANRAAPLILI